jgi:hypothetical protein
MKPGLPIAAIALLTLLAVGAQAALVARAGFFMGDFYAFYCGAHVAATGADPYTAEPLRSCERGTGLNAFFRVHPGAAVPAPLPGYALAAFMPLAALPPAVAAALWLALSIGALALAVIALARCAGVFWTVPLSAFALSVGAASLPLGEVVALALGALCVSAWCAKTGRWYGAAAAAAVTMVEPHIGLPACLALAIWAPKTRPMLLGLAALAAVASLVAIGPAGNVEYFARVLPAHALSEAARDTQFSLTAVLTSLGAAPPAAVRAGTWWYAAMLVLGIIVGARVAKRTGDAAFLVCVPPAFALLGGTFVHVTQMAAALPAAVLLLARSDRRTLPIALFALILLAVPWLYAWSPALGVAPALPVAYLVWLRFHRLIPAGAAAVAAALALVGLNRAWSAGAHAVARRVPIAIDPNLAQAAWARFAGESSHGALGAWLVRLPTWLGLTVLLATLIAFAVNAERRVALKAVEARAS